MNKSNHKHERIESEILNNLNHTLKNEINDKILRMSCFTRVKLLDDFSKAIVSVDYYIDKQIQDVVDQLNVAKGIFRNALAKNMSIRKIPEIIFEKDMTIQKSLKIEQIINKINTHSKK